MRLFFRNSQIREHVQDCLRLYFQFPGQLVNSNHMVTLGRIPLIGLLLLLLHGIPLATKSIAFSRITFASRAHGQRFLEKNNRTF